VCRTTDPREYAAALQQLNLAIKERFDTEKLEFAFPTQTIMQPDRRA
jgi:small-conductance mechanosensitive channel